MAVAAERLALQNLRPSCNVLGIDLGTTNTVVAIWQAGKPSPEVLTVENNERNIPSYVWCKADGTFVVGRDAVRNLKQFPQDVCYDAKRMIGQNFTNMTQLQSDYWGFQIVNNNGRPAYELSNGKMIEDEEISVQVLKKAKAIADAYAYDNLKYAVITVPACFDQNQKDATINAAEKAGLTVLQLETESTAAAYAYNYDNKRCDDYNLFVFDLGGGFFNISIISVKDGRLNIGAIGGADNLGGRDFDNLLMKELKKRMETLGEPKYDEVQQRTRLRVLAETTKVALTTCDKEIVNCTDFFANATDKDVMMEITRAEFEKLAFQLKGFLRDACLEAMKRANLTSDEFANVLLIGGSSRMPMVSQLLNELFPQSLDSFFYQSRALDPDTAVAYGAAIRAAQLLDPNHRDLINGVLPIGIGIGLTKGHYLLMIPGGTKYPTKNKKRFYTIENNQKYAHIIIYEGEQIQANQNREILSITVPNLPPRIAGDVYFDITFKLNHDGILRVIIESPVSVIEETIDCKSLRQSGKPIEQLLRVLTFNAENNEQKIIQTEARMELRSNVENTKKRFENLKNIPLHKKKLIMENCETIIDWLEDNPDEPLDEERINLAKQIEKDAEELIDLRLMTIS